MLCGVYFPVTDMTALSIVSLMFFAKLYEKSLLNKILYVLSSPSYAEAEESHAAADGSSDRSFDATSANFLLAVSVGFFAGFAALFPFPAG